MTRPILSDMYKIFLKGVTAVHPESLIRKNLLYDKNSQVLSIHNKRYDIINKNIYVVGSGKAVLHMARETEHILGSKIKEGIVSVPTGSYQENIKSIISYNEGAHDNLPDVKAQETALKIKNLLEKLTHDDVVIVLISGGGSALLPLPLQPISLDEKLSLIKHLSHAGADIKELNTVRKKLSALKGGKLAITAKPAKIISLILSDIVGDPLDLIASGPTAKNSDHYLKAKQVIEKYNIFDKTPESIKLVIDSHHDDEDFPSSVDNFIIGSNRLSIHEAAEEARNLNYEPVQVSYTITGNVTEIAKEYSLFTKLITDLLSEKINLKQAEQKLKQTSIEYINTDWIKNANNWDRDICFIFGGETTVYVKGSGKGGRNQQLALEFSKCLHEIRDEFVNFDIEFLSAGTDGIDGPTDAAGAIGYLNLVSEALDQGLDINDYLSNNDSYNFYKKFKENKYHIITGHTGTNVMDIHLLIIRKKIKNKL